MKRDFFSENKCKIDLFQSKTYFFAELILVFSLLILPMIITSFKFLFNAPVQFVNPPEKFKFNPMIFFYLIPSLSLYLLVEFIPLKSSYLNYRKNKSLLPISKAVILSVISFIFIVIVALTINFSAADRNISFQLDGTKKQVVLFILQFFIISLYEEILFRKYLPNRLFNLINSNSGKIKLKTCRILVVLISAVLFSVPHVYEGYAGAIFAFISALVFSTLYDKTGNLLFPFGIHFIYNTAVFLAALH